MKPLGTITACFPHVDEETRNILQSIMDEAKDLDDFAEILCNRACVESFTPLAIYFAYFFSFNQSKFNLIDKLQEARKYSVLAKPLLLSVQTIRGLHVEWREFRKAIAEAIEASQGDWITCHIYMGWKRFVEGLYPESSTDSRALGILESKIEIDHDLSFFLSYLYSIRANRLSGERSVNEAIKMFNQAIIQAKEHDNILDYTSLLAQKANLVKRINIDEALSILEVHREVCERFGFIAGVADNDLNLGHIAMAKGEFNLGVHYQDRYLQVHSSLRFPSGYPSTLIAQLYNMMGDGAKALELITGTRQEIDRGNILFTLIHEAWALVNLDRIDEAEKSITKAKELVLKSDDEVRLGLTYFVEGLIEKSRHEFASASYTLENALDIFERYYSQAFVNITLIHLTDIEIESFSYKTTNEKLESSGPWMKKLLDLVAKKDLPGIDAQSKLLRAKFLFKQAQFTQSKKLIKEVLKTSKFPGLQYLENMVKLMLPELLI
ncbi:MAG: hypothetical protein ACFFD3_06030 [Candidatus Thorarchaeota archaeon]